MTDIYRKSAKEALIDAAFAVLRQNPSAPLSHIADAAGVGRATLHRYFSSRESLISALSHIAIKEMDEAVEDACADAPSYGEAMRLTLEVLIPMGDRHGFLALETLEHDPELEAQLARQDRETAEMVEAAKQEGLFAPDVPTPWIVQAFEHLLYAAWESVKAGDATPKQASALAWRTLTTGLKGDQT
ncbi:MAG: TetR/AcrR family transcriptional regulator [Pseudomonadota bacterium]